MRSRVLRSVLVALLPLTTACGYNTIQQLDEQATAAQRSIEVQLQRRADLVPNLVNTVKGYAAHEEAIFTNVANARARLSGAISSGDATAMANANAGLTSALGRLLAIQENYPALKADRNFLQLQDELTGTENRIATSRNDFNEAVRQYNTYIRQFPQVITAKVTGAKQRNGFEVTDAGAREVPTVDFGKTSPTPPAPPATPTKTP